MALGAGSMRGTSSAGSDRSSPLSWASITYPGSPGTCTTTQLILSAKHHAKMLDAACLGSHCKTAMRADEAAPQLGLAST